MPRFRRRVPVVEAFQFDPEGAHKTELPSGVTYTDFGCYVGRDTWTGEKVLSKYFIGSCAAPKWIYQGDWLVEKPNVGLVCYTEEDFMHLYEPLAEKSPFPALAEHAVGEYRAGLVSVRRDFAREKGVPLDAEGKECE